MNKPYVAEVWLEWEICRGSTMVRRKFKHLWTAALFAKIAAMIVDFHLPSYYRAEYSDGEPYLEKYGFEIHYGIRQLGENEIYCPVWSLVMPGNRRSTAEHREAHPFYKL
jgi:hypothetical protein